MHSMLDLHPVAVPAATRQEAPCSTTTTAMTMPPSGNDLSSANDVTTAASASNAATRREATPPEACVSAAPLPTSCDNPSCSYADVSGDVSSSSGLAAQQKVNPSTSKAALSPSSDGDASPDAAAEAEAELPSLSTPANRREVHSTSGAKLLSSSFRERMSFGSSRSSLSISTGRSGGSKGSGKKVSANIEGNTIDAEHKQYDLSVAMMVGIRFSVGKTAFEERKREQARGGPLASAEAHFAHEHYSKVERYVFPYSAKSPSSSSTDSEMEAKLFKTFKFRAYAPFVFSKIRQLTGVDKEQFIESLCGNSNFIEFMSNSNSGEFFFYSHDGRYMIKTQTYQEIKFILKILPDYYKYLVDNPNSFLTHYYGVYHVKIPHLGQNVPFVIMKSVFDTDKRIHKMWDLKGSTKGRRAKEGHTVKKDLDVVDSGEKLNIGPEKKAMVLDQLRKDAAFLATMNIMDYSLLVGVHSRKEERIKNSSSVHESFGSVIEVPEGDSDVNDQTSSPLSLKCSPRKRTTHDIRGMRELAYFLLQQATEGEYGEDLSSDDSSSICDSEEYSPTDSSLCKFVYDEPEDGLSLGADTHASEHSYTDVVEYTEASDSHIEVLWVTAVNGITEREDLGIESWMVDTETMQSKEIYFLGVIDILQYYTARKMAENFIKSTHQNAQEISCVDPQMYAERFVKFCSSVME